MRLLKPTETGRGSGGQFLDEAVKASSTVVNQESEIHVKFGLLIPPPPLKLQQSLQIFN